MKATVTLTKMVDGKETIEEKEFRSMKIQEATLIATLVPLEVTEFCLESLKKIETILPYANRNTTSDLGVSILMIHAGFEGAIMNVLINIGGLKDETFDQLTRSFESGDVLIQLSDGLPEAPNAKGELYDYDQLKSLIQSSGQLSAQKIIDVLIESVDQWLEGNRNPDDITLVVTKKIA